MDGVEIRAERCNLEREIRKLLNDYTQKYKFTCNCEIAKIYELNGTRLPVDYRVNIAIEL